MGKCLCGSSIAQPLFQIGNYTIAECVNCHQVRTLTPDSVMRTQEYGQADISIYIEKEEMFRRLFRNVLDFVGKFVREGTLIDIGSGVGLLVDEATRVGFKALGFEPSVPSVKAAKKYFHISLIAQEFSPTLVPKHVNVVVINHVLEHVVDPKKLLRQVAQIVKPGGFIFIGVPNFGSIMRMVKKSRWQSLIPDQHRWHFTVQTLDNLVLPYGFGRVGLTGDNHDRSSYSWWKRVIYWVIDAVALITSRREAMLVAYKKII